MSLGDFFDDLAVGDELEEVEGSIGQLLAQSRRTNELLAALLDSKGNVDLAETAAVAQPYAYAEIPPDQSQRLGVRPGRTTIDFDDGTVEHEFDGILYDDDQVTTFRDISRSLDEVTARFRSVVFEADQKVHVRLDNGDWIGMHPGTAHELRDVSFTKMDVECPEITELRATATTRAEPNAYNRSTLSMERLGDHIQHSNGTYANGSSVTWTAPDLHDRHGFSFSSSLLNVRWYGRKTIEVRNTSSLANDMDVRVVGRNADQEKVEIAETTGLSQNDHTIFDINQRWNIIEVQTKASTGGNTVDCEATMVAGGS